MPDFKNYFEQKFQIKIHSQKFYDIALTHNSYANEHHLKYTYQRLEFLGDAIIEKFISILLYKKFPDENEGELTKRRSDIVRTETLSKVTKRIGLNKYLRLGNGEETSGGRNKESILADMFESVTAAVYMDAETSGQDPEKVLRHWLNQTLLDYIQLDEYKNKAEIYDYKSELQELLQAEKRSDLVYKVIHEERKKDNRMFYTIQVELDGSVYGTGTGNSKQEAEQEAAKEGLMKLRK
jgi:ribonuclease-3